MFQTKVKRGTLPGDLLLLSSLIALLGTLPACEGTPAAPDQAPPLPSGTLVVTVSTGGASFDPDGYTVLVDGTSVGTVSIDGTLSVQTTVSTHEVYLEGNAFNCYVEQKEPIAVTVTADQAVNVALSVHCVTPLTDWLLYTTRGSSGYSIVRVFPANPNVSQRLVVSDARQAAVTRDGTRLAFYRGGDIYTMWVDGSDLTLLVPDGAQPRWSPDGTRVTYSRQSAVGTSSIHIIHADGTDDVNVTEGELDAWDPDWSPDGSNLAYVQRHPRGERSIVVRALSNGDTTILHRGQVETPRWSPDGRTIAFVDLAYSQILDAFTSHIALKNVSSPATPTLALTEVGLVSSDSDPVWSPDGRELVFVSTRGRLQRKLWITGVFVLSPRRVFPGSGVGGDLEIEPAWAPSSSP